MIIMINIMMIFLSGCAQMIPGIDKVIDDYVTDEAIQITIDKAALQHDTNLKINVDVTNKNEVQKN